MSIKNAKMENGFTLIKFNPAMTKANEPMHVIAYKGQLKQFAECGSWRIEKSSSSDPNEIQLVANHSRLDGKALNQHLPYNKTNKDTNKRDYKFSYAIVKGYELCLMPDD